MEEYTISLNDLKAILLRRRWGLILPACALFWIAVGAAFVLPSIYRSQATILIEEQEIPANLVQTTVTSYAEQRLQNIYQRVISTQNLVEIINKFNLYPELRAKVTPDEVAATMKKDVVLDFVKADIVDPKTGRPSTATIAFTLAYQGKNPEQTQKVTSALTSFFLEENLKDRTKKASSASSFLQDEVNRVKEAMAESDAKIADFKEKHFNELPELLPVNMQTLQSIEANNDRLTEQMRTLREREGYLEAQLASLPKAERQGRQNTRLEDLQMQLANLKTRYSDQYPDVIAVKAEIAKLSAEGGGGKGSSAENPAYVTLKAQLASTRADMESLKRQMADNEQKKTKYRAMIEATPRVEETYKAMINERENQLRKYNELMQKHMEAQVAQGLEKDQYGERFTVVEPAQLPDKPVKPNRMAIVLIGIVLGVGAGVGTAALMEFSDQTVRSAERLAEATSFPVLTVIPEILSEQEIRRGRRWNMVQVVGLAVLAGLALVALVLVRSKG
jgi:polysaccharide chain length determinant protein (PEP-CTERM system associated)